MNTTELSAVLALHRKWLLGEEGGARANLSGANLSRANLSRADLSRADLSWANLSRADLSWANLSGANLSRANLSWANLSRADLSGADLSRANLSRANLSRANLSRDVLWETYLDQVVPALLTAGGKTLAEVATPETWACHAWSRSDAEFACPMSVAFSCGDLSGVPPLYRDQAARFIQFFDAGLIPMPTIEGGA